MGLAPVCVAAAVLPRVGRAGPLDGMSAWFTVKILGKVFDAEAYERWFQEAVGVAGAA